MDITQQIGFANQQLQTGQADRASAALSGAGKTERAARAAAEDFEAVFLSQMLSPMFETIETDELFGGGQSEKIYRSMMVEEMGKEIAKAGGIGIADQVYREILRAQEA